MVNDKIAKSITKFAIPCILIRVIQNLYPLLDSLVVGKVLNIESLSAIGIATYLYSFFNEVFLGLVSGFSIIVSKKFGAKNKRGLVESFYNALLLSLILCTMATSLGLFFSNQMLTALKTPDSLMECARDYIFVILLGLVPNMLYNFICEMLRAIGDSKTPLILLVISSVIHIVILYPLTRFLGVIGTALAIIISYLITVVLGFIHIYKKTPVFTERIEKSLFKTSTMRECLSIGAPMGITSFVVMFGVLILSFVTNNIGAEYVAAYTSASKIGYILTTPIFGFSTSIAVFASQNFGAKNYDAINKGVSETLKTVTVINIVITVIVFLFAKPFLRFMLENSQTAVNAGFLYLCIRCLSTAVLTPAAVYKNLLPAIGKPFFSTLSGFLEIGVRFLFPLMLSEILGFSVVPLTDTASWLAISVLVFFSYKCEFRKLRNKL